MRKEKRLSNNNDSKLFYLFIFFLVNWILCFYIFPYDVFFGRLFYQLEWIDQTLIYRIEKLFYNFHHRFTFSNFFEKYNVLCRRASVPLNLILSIFLASLLNKRSSYTNFFRAIFYLPTICTGVASYITWLYLFNSDFGFLNILLSRIGLPGVPWLSDMDLAMPSIIFMDMFVCGTSMTIVLASLQDIPTMYYEAADLDGASNIQKFMNITFPMISPVVFFNLLMMMFKGLQIFTQPYVMTEGGPANATYVYGLHLYKSAFLYTQFGYASSLAWVLFYFSDFA